MIKTDLYIYYLTMEQLYSLVNNLNKNSSNLAKIKTLSLITDKDLLNLIEMIYNPDKPFHVSSDNVIKFRKQYTASTTNKLELLELLKLLNTRTATGHEALELVCIYLDTQDIKYHELILNAINKDLKIGMNVKNINKAMPGLIHAFPGIALGVPYEEKIVTDDDWLISRKLDGVRCITVIKDQHDIQFYSRQGKPFHVLENLKLELSKNYTSPMVLDGEIAVMNTETGIEDFQGIMKMIRKKNYTIENPRYFIFDVLTLDEFYNEKSDICLSERLKRYSGIVIEQVPLDQLNLMNERVLAEGWEGLMLRRNVGYQGKRSRDILKLKQFFTEEYTVVSIENGTIRHHNGSNYTDLECMTAVYIQNKGVMVKVGSGFSHNERIEFFNHPERIIGKVIAVQFFEETSDHSLRFPTFKGIYGISRDI